MAQVLMLVVLVEAANLMVISSVDLAHQRKQTSFYK
jgi:hypothetical protein